MFEAAEMILSWIGQFFNTLGESIATFFLSAFPDADQGYIDAIDDLMDGIAQPYNGLNPALFIDWNIVIIGMSIWLFTATFYVILKFVYGGVNIVEKVKNIISLLW